MTFNWRHIGIIAAICCVLAVVASSFSMSSFKTRRARMEACFSGLSDESRETFNCDEFLKIQKPI